MEGSSLTQESSAHLIPDNTINFVETILPKEPEITLLPNESVSDSHIKLTRKRTSRAMVGMELINMPTKKQCVEQAHKPSSVKPGYIFPLPEVSVPSIVPSPASLPSLLGFGYCESIKSMILQKCHVLDGVGYIAAEDVASFINHLNQNNKFKTSNFEGAVSTLEFVTLHRIAFPLAKLIFKFKGDRTKYYTYSLANEAIAMNAPIYRVLIGSCGLNVLSSGKMSNVVLSNTVEIFPGTDEQLRIQEEETDEGFDLVC